MNFKSYHLHRLISLKKVFLCIILSGISMLHAETETEGVAAKVETKVEGVSDLINELDQKAIEDGVNIKTPTRKVDAIDANALKEQYEAEAKATLELESQIEKLKKATEENKDEELDVEAVTEKVKEINREREANIEALEAVEAREAALHQETIQESKRRQDKLENLSSVIKKSLADLRVKKIKSGQLIMSRQKLLDEEIQKMNRESESIEELKVKMKRNREIREDVYNQSIASEKAIREELFDMIKVMVEEIPQFASDLEKAVKDINEYERVMNRKFALVKEKYKLSTEEFMLIISGMGEQVTRLVGEVRAARDALSIKRDMKEYEERTGYRWNQDKVLAKNYRKIEEMIANRENKTTNEIASLRDELKNIIAYQRKRDEHERGDYAQLKRENALLKQAQQSTIQDKNKSWLQQENFDEPFSNIDGFKRRGLRKVDDVLELPEAFNQKNHSSIDHLNMSDFEGSRKPKNLTNYDFTVEEISKEFSSENLGDLDLD